MSYMDRDTFGMYESLDEKGPGPALMGADTLSGNDVYNHKEEDLGDIKEIMLDMRSAKLHTLYCRLADFSVWAKNIAVPWNA